MYFLQQSFISSRQSSMKRFFILSILCCSSVVAMADTCLQTDKKGSEGDSRHYDYGSCTPSSSSANTGGAVNAVGQQMLNLMSHESDNNDRGYSDAEREANRNELAAFDKEQKRRRESVKIGSTEELYRQEYFKLENWQYQNANITDAQMQAIRDEVAAAINTNQLLDLYGKQHYDDVKDVAT